MIELCELYPPFVMIYMHLFFCGESFSRSMSPLFSKPHSCLSFSICTMCSHEHSLVSSYLYFFLAHNDTNIFDYTRRSKTKTADPPKKRHKKKQNMNHVGENGIVRIRPIRRRFPSYQRRATAFSPCHSTRHSTCHSTCHVPSRIAILLASSHAYFDPGVDGSQQWLPVSSFPRA